MTKLVTLLLISSFLLVPLYSYTNISNCAYNLGNDNLNNISEREFRLTQDVTRSAPCFTFDNEWCNY